MSRNEERMRKLRLVSIDDFQVRIWSKTSKMEKETSHFLFPLIINKYEFMSKVPLLQVLRHWGYLEFQKERG